MENYIIEQATKDELSEILELFVRVNNQAHHFLGSEKIETAKNLIRDEYFELSTTLMIKNNNQIVAFITSIDNEISDLYVEAEFQSKGYGSALLNHMVNNYQCDTVQVFEDNQKAVEYYLKAGFKKVASAIDEEYGVVSYTMRLSN